MLLPGFWANALSAMWRVQSKLWQSKPSQDKQCLLGNIDAILIAVLKIGGADNNIMQAETLVFA